MTRNYLTWIAGESMDYATVVAAESAGKAAYSRWLDVNDVCDLPFTSMRARLTDRETKAERLDRECSEWNANHPVGTPVRYWTWVREGPGVESQTRSHAVVMCDHVSVWVVGEPGCINVTHVEAIR